MSTPPQSAVFAVRIVSVDHYMARPSRELDVCFSSFQGQPVLKVPVVRVFGATPAGQKCCLHLHKAFPYLFVPYPDDMPLERDRIDRYARQLAASIEHALSLPRGASAAQDAAAAPAVKPTQHRHVFQVSLVRGIPFYGYSPCEATFMKIYLYDPRFLSSVANLLRSGAVMGTNFQPYEAHLPFSLQLFIDNNLFGMGLLSLSRVSFRDVPKVGPHGVGVSQEAFAASQAAKPGFSSRSLRYRVWIADDTPQEMLSGLPRLSMCELEADACVEDILNIRELELHSGDAVQTQDRKLVQSLASMWEEDRAMHEPGGSGEAREAPKEPKRNPLPFEHEQRDRALIREIVKKSARFAQEAEFAAFTQHSQSAEFPRVMPSNKTYVPSLEETGHAPPSQDRSDMQFTASVDPSKMSKADIQVAEDLAWLREQSVDIPSDDEDENSPQLSQKEVDDIMSSAEQPPDDKPPPGNPPNPGSADIPQFDGPVDDLSSKVRKKRGPQRRFGPLFSHQNALGNTTGSRHHRIGTSDYEDDEELPHKKRVTFKPLTVRSTSSRGQQREAAFRVAPRLEANLQSQLPDDVLADPFAVPAPPPVSKPKPVVVSLLDESQQEAPKSNIPSTPVAAAAATTAATPKGLRLMEVTVCVPSVPPPGSVLVPATQQLSPGKLVPSTCGTPVRIPATGAIRESPDTVVPSTMLPVEMAATRPIPPNFGSSPMHISPSDSSPASAKVAAAAAATTTTTSMEMSSPADRKELEASPLPRKLQRRSDPVPGQDVSQGPPSPLSWRALIDIEDEPNPPPSIPLQPGRVHGQTPGSSPTQRVRILQPVLPPPNLAELATSMAAQGIPADVPVHPFFSDARDVPPKPFCYGGREIRVTVKPKSWMAPVPGDRAAPVGPLRILVPAVPPPTTERLIQSLSAPTPAADLSDEVEWAPEVKKKDQETINTAIQMIAERTQGADLLVSSGSSWNHNQHITLVNIEVHVNARGQLMPNPERDPLTCICFCVRDDDAVECLREEYRDTLVVMLVDDSKTPTPSHCYGLGCSVESFPDERAMLKAFVSKILGLDPDIITGYEVQCESLGFIANRAKALGIDICLELSRVKTPGAGESIGEAAIGFGKDVDEWGYQHASGFHIPGRIVLNIWRIMRSEVRATLYSLSNVAAVVLGWRISHFSHEEATKMWHEGRRAVVLSQLLQRTHTPVLLLDALNIIGRTSELARVFGIDFFSVLARGSQYRVESMLFRLTKPQNFILISPSKSDVAQQRAPECIPLVLEPVSEFFASPVAVLDFQSLYPSIIIGYNYCYSTCLGSIAGSDSSLPKKFGCSRIQTPDGFLEFIEKKLTISPNHVMFVNSEVRRGVLPRMLQEILDTRIMVKKALKRTKGRNRALERMLDSRQFGLKMIANVTYGYTGATFSGRMPCVEIADAIVETARQTLCRAIRMVNETPEWRAKVVYGDTDSMFVHLPGRTLPEAFEIGQAIAARVTAANPEPVRLQFEKVYLPSILVSKKRYVGYKYESCTDGRPPVLEAKGIETVRRDTCPLVQKIVDSSIRLLFDTRDLSSVRRFLERQFDKIEMFRASPADFIFAKEVRLGTYRGTHLPPAAQVALAAMQKDPCAEPRFGERVPYLVVCGGPGSRLMDLVVSPDQFISQGSLRLHAAYYISKQVVPPLQRLFGPAGADVVSWHSALAARRKVVPLMIEAPPPAPGKQPTTIDQFYRSVNCLVCANPVTKRECGSLCENCLRNLPAASCALRCRVRVLCQKLAALDSICRQCCGSRSARPECNSIECPIFFRRAMLQRSLSSFQRQLDDSSRSAGGVQIL